MKINCRCVPNFVTLTKLALVLGTACLSGCVAVALAPLVPMVTGVAEAGVLVTIDTATFSAPTKAALQQAKTLGVVSMDRAAIRAADLFETRGGYLVTIDRVAAKQGEMTGSERRAALAGLCSAKGVDVALLGHVTKTETNNTAVAAVTGRSKTMLSWTMDVLVCKGRTGDSFSGTAVVDVGIYAGNPAKIEEAFGQEMGMKILQAIGKVGADQSAPTVAPQSSNPALPPVTAAVAQATTAPKAIETGKKIITLIDAQRRLGTLGYLKGKPDGIWGKQSTEALKKFQQTSGLQATGLIDFETSEKLQSSQK